MTRLLVIALTALLILPVTQANAQQTPLRLCTGGEQGNYFAFGKELRQQLAGSVQVEVITTKGSVDNFDKMARGECDAAMAQSDTLQTYKSAVDVDRVGTAYREWVHLICNKATGPNGVGDLEDAPTNYVMLTGPNGSGTSVTWNSFIKQDDDYAAVPTKPIGGSQALTKIIDGTEAQCMMFIAGLGSLAVKNADEMGNGQLALVPVNDGDFNDAEDAKGNRVYEFDDFPSDIYPGLQDCGFTGCNNPETLTLGAVFYVSQAWIGEHDAEYGKVSDAFLRAKKNWAAAHGE